MISYHDRLTEAMALIAERPNAVFLGQGVGNPGTTMSSTFARVPQGRLLEMPVAEDMQMGMATGMALGGLLPVCVFPRWNFLLCAANQIVNHLDRLPIYSNGGYRPKVLIRVATPSTHPFNPQSQHDDDMTRAFRLLLRTVFVDCLYSADEVVPAYEAALRREYSTILVEYTDLYRDARGDVEKEAGSKVYSQQAVFRAA